MILTVKNKKRSKEDKHLRILDAAESIIEIEGLQGLSINKVARKAKIAKGTVYIYFKSKEEIIAGLTIRARKTLLEYFKKYCEPQTDPIVKIRSIFWADYNFYQEQRSYHQLVVFYEQHTGLKETGQLSITSQAIARYVASIIEDARVKGLIRQDIHSGMQGFMFWGMVVGMMQIIDTKQGQIGKYFGISADEFFSNFVDNAIRSILIDTSENFI